MTKKLISILIPAYNEEEVLGLLFARLKELAEKNTAYDFEFFFVNDGSRDKTYEIIRDHAEKDTRVGYINLSRNFGKEVAMIAGFFNKCLFHIKIVFGQLRNLVLHPYLLYQPFFEKIVF